MFRLEGCVWNANQFVFSWRLLFWAGKALWENRETEPYLGEPEKEVSRVMNNPRLSSVLIMARHLHLQKILERERKSIY